MKTGSWPERWTYRDRMNHALTTAQHDRALGMVLGSAVGDALGAGYEFGSASYRGRPDMIGGGLGNFAPGEWTDDTAQAVAILDAVADGLDLRTAPGLDRVAANIHEWFDAGPPDVGNQTAQVLRRAARLAGGTPTGAQLAKAAEQVHDETGRSAGNGSLMRTAPVVLAYLGPDADAGPTDAALADAAMRVSALTHFQDLAQEGTALWCLMLRHTVLTAEYPSTATISDAIPNPDRWLDLLREAERRNPGDFTQNTWVVGALQAAWSAITHTPADGADRGSSDQDEAGLFARGLATAIGIGVDTDTVAAIAGALLGARWGASAIPEQWLRLLHGWAPASRGGLLDAIGLTALVERTIGAGPAEGGVPGRLIGRPRRCRTGLA